MKFWFAMINHVLYCIVLAYKRVRYFNFLEGMSKVYCLLSNISNVNNKYLTILSLGSKNAGLVIFDSQAVLRTFFTNHNVV